MFSTIIFTISYCTFLSKKFLWSYKLRISKFKFLYSIYQPNLVSIKFITFIIRSVWNITCKYIKYKVYKSYYTYYTYKSKKLLFIHSNILREGVGGEYFFTNIDVNQFGHRIFLKVFYFYPETICRKGFYFISCSYIIKSCI